MHSALKKKVVISALVVFGGLLAGLCLPLHAYTVVELAPGVPVSVEKSLIAATTAQFTTTIKTNPFFPNTYTLTITGLNPNFNPSPTNLQLLNAMVAVSTHDFVYGFADGQDYQNNVNINQAATYEQLCGSATNFMLNQSVAGTFDKGTCQDTLGTLVSQMFQINLSTPTVIPPNGD